MFNRRTLFAGTGATVALSALLSEGFAQAAEMGKSSGGAAPRGADGRLKRLGSLDLESQQDFTLAFRLMQKKQIQAAAFDRFDKVLAAKGIDPTTPMTVEEMLVLVENEPSINISSKTWITNQQITWKTLQDYFHANADLYLSEMEAADRSGPGSLELNPKLDIRITPATKSISSRAAMSATRSPDISIITAPTASISACWAITTRPDPQGHRQPPAHPADGKVKRILDMGCGVGQLTCALKERFPDAEVWGLDVGGPMVRYSHMRARDLNIPVNFVQRLAEDTKFPDNYFDLTTSYIMHHELPADITRKVIAEAQRITRPGGVYYPIDFLSGGTKGPARAMYGRWWDHRWNNEVWSLEYHSIDFTAEIGQRGFTVVPNPVAALPGFGARHTIKV